MSTNPQVQDNVVSGGVVGGFFNGGNHGTVIVTTQGLDAPIQPYSARIIRTLPRQSTLAVLTSLATLFTFVTGWKSLAPVFETIRSVRDGLFPSAPSSGAPTLWLVAFAASFLGLAALVSGMHLVRTQTFQPPRLSLFPVLAGITDSLGTKRLALLRLRGRCQNCGGELRFYLKPVEWHFETVDGRRKRVVDLREPAAECRKNPRHWYTLEITDRVV